HRNGRSSAVTSAFARRPNGSRRVDKRIGHRPRPSGYPNSATRSRAASKSAKATKMIAAVDGTTVMRFLERMKRDARAYSEILICSPFIDPKEFSFITQLMQLTRRNCSALRVISRHEAIQTILAYAQKRLTHQTESLIVHPRIHAKVYL